MKVAVYACVFTSDKGQDLEAQLMALCDYCRAQGWDIYREYSDQASANDLAEFELEMIRERVKAGMDRARRQGHPIGRPSVWHQRGFQKSYRAVLERLGRQELSRRQAAKELGIGYATFKRLLDQRVGERAVIKPTPEAAA